MSVRSDLRTSDDVYSRFHPAFTCYSGCLNIDAGGYGWRRQASGLDTLKFTPLGLLGVVQVPAQLQIQPEVRRHAKNFARRSAVLGVTPRRPRTISLIR
jgi:hypothetical protein